MDQSEREAMIARAIEEARVAVPGATSDVDQYAHLLSVVNDLESKAEAVKSDPSSSKGAKERAGAALFKAKKDLKPVAKVLMPKLKDLKE